jgi:aspartyl-tRNA(Asn)/glutamyl-tRNA(Gln) amidotransferase subunit A
MPAEVSTNLARFDGIRYGNAKRGATLLDDYLETRTEGFGEEVTRRILLGTFVLSSGYIDAYYRKADAARAVLMNEYDAAFENVDVIAFPTTPSPAFKFGEKGDDPVSMYLEDVFTVTANLTGMPAISVPMGMVERDGNQLPTGIHFTAPTGGVAIWYWCSGNRGDVVTTTEHVDDRRSEAAPVVRYTELNGDGTATDSLSQRRIFLPHYL